ncbi:acyl-coenzyme A synthetase/AMP-(fatty) acid ligase [Inhella inkyongensis]|uniref:Acyl-coenzyme A synthetase/AMP-(Fatty) acid ligase n=1 Tax=Inhella inkyongensis TaxID=392593 RepID=A0A840SBB8_9BURK|nr:AMP-binding protein [Inhella inkyongensis]MBB5205761.1 acyl-coenzyme A synthetase/AMP-(fatty) acid ligase [Inhella inkyongensis]
MWRELSLGLSGPISPMRAAQPVGWRAGQALSWADWCAEAAQWYATFAAQPGRELALYFEDSLAAAAALMAAWHAGKQVWWPGDTLPATCLALSTSVQAFAGDWPSVSLGGRPLLRPARATAVDWQPLDIRAEGLVVFTSGSTGAPTAIRKRLQQLFDEVHALEAAFGARLQGASVQGTVSHQHIYGLLFRLLWPLAAGRPLAAQRVGYLEDLATASGRLAVVASPAHLKRLQASRLDGLAPRLAALFSSGGPLPDEALAPCRAQLGQTPIEVYGSSETGGVAWRQRAPGAQEDPSWQPLPGVEWRLEGELLHLRSPQIGGDAWFQAQDRARAEGQGFVLLGRADRIVKIEEKRVSIAAVEQALRACGGVEALALPLLPGARQELGVVLVPDAAAWSEIETQGRSAWLAPRRAALAALLEPTVRPRRWRLVGELPANVLGKSTQAALCALFDPLRPPARLRRTEATSASFEIEVEPGHPGFAGHFPEHPVLPGVVQLDWAERLAREAFAEMPAQFAGMEQLKFQQVIQPGTRLLLELNWDAARGQLRFAFTSARGAHSSGRLLFQA